MRARMAKGERVIDVRVEGWYALTVAMVVAFIVLPLPLLLQSKEISLGRFG